MKTRRFSYLPLLFSALLFLSTTSSSALNAEKAKNAQSASISASTVASATASLSSHCAVGCPTGGSDVTLHREAYALNNNAETKFANWVAYRITHDSTASGRKRNWRKDPDIPAGETLSPSDYDGANAALQMHRGHQAGLAAMSGVPDWEALNFLSNITPQRDHLNTGAWARLEDKERQLAKKIAMDASTIDLLGEDDDDALSDDQEVAYGDVYVLTGPLYERYIGTLPQAKKPHIIPSGYWKLISVGSTPENGMYASFVMDQDTPRNANFCDFQATVGEIEQRSGLTIWTELPAEVQAALKTQQGRLSKAIGCE